MTAALQTAKLEVEQANMKPYVIALTAVGAAALVSAPWVVPKALQAVTLMTQQDNVVAIAEYQLNMLPPQAFQNAIEQALTDGDPELAASLVEVATDATAPLPADLVQRVTDAQGFDAGRLAGDFWNGIVKGDASSEAGLGGSLIADFSGVGDARDLIVEGNNYLTSGTYDPVVLTLSAVGLTLTAATLATGGAAAPARTGVTVLKAAKKAGQLPAPLVRELGEIAVRAIDGAALDQTIAAAKRLDVSGASAAAGRILSPTAAKTVTGLADDVAGIAGESGYRAVNQTLRVASSTADISKLWALASATGTKFRGVLQLLGAGGSIALTWLAFPMVLGGWAVSGLIWLMAAGFTVVGFGYRAVAWLGRRRKNKTLTSAV